MGIALSPNGTNELFFDIGLVLFLDGAEGRCADRDEPGRRGFVGSGFAPCVLRARSISTCLSILLRLVPAPYVRAVHDVCSVIDRLQKALGKNAWEKRLGKALGKGAHSLYNDLCFTHPRMHRTIPIYVDILRMPGSDSQT